MTCAVTFTHAVGIVSVTNSLQVLYKSSYRDYKKSNLHRKEVCLSHGTALFQYI